MGTIACLALAVLTVETAASALAFRALDQEAVALLLAWGVVETKGNKTRVSVTMTRAPSYRLMSLEKGGQVWTGMIF